MPQLEVIGSPDTVGVAFYSKKNTFNIYCIQSFLSKLGWDINSLQSPPAVSFVITMANYKNVDLLARQIKQAVDEVQITIYNRLCRIRPNTRMGLSAFMQLLKKFQILDYLTNSLKLSGTAILRTTDKLIYPL